MLGRGVEESVFVGDVPVDRAGTGRQSRGECAEGERGLPLGVEDLDGGGHDAIGRQRVMPA